MELKKLIEIQKSGALKVSGNINAGEIIVGGVKITPEQCNQFVKQLGWLEWGLPATTIIEKTDKFIRNFCKYVNFDSFIMGTTITFQNRRLSNTMRYFDRIHFTNSKFGYTIIYNMPGNGGAYALYSSEDNTHLPIYTCRSIKQLGEFFVEEFGIE